MHFVWEYILNGRVKYCLNINSKKHGYGAKLLRELESISAKCAQK
jgi:hypothetical protein